MSSPRFLLVCSAASLNLADLKKLTKTCNVLICHSFKAALALVEPQEINYCLIEKSLEGTLDCQNFTQALGIMAKPVNIDFVVSSLQQVQLRINEFQQLNTKAISFEQFILSLNATKRIFDPNTSNLIGQTDCMIELKQIIAKVAQSDANVYISGPSGAGKELVARALHFSGARAQGPFIAINCGAIPRDLLESEFFGHKKGAFTGAHQDKLGLFQAAESGTLFLDEIAELNLEMQVKLLRVIQLKTVRPIGSEHEIAINVRFLCATHQALHKLIQAKLFREDLFYRINVIEIKVPALKERQSDIPLIAEYLIEKLAKKNRFSPPAINHCALEKLSHYHFPGNVRELENILERALIMHDSGPIRAKDIVFSFYKEPEQNLCQNKLDFQLGVDNLDHYLDHLARNLTKAALEQTKWNKSKAAKLLGIPLRNLLYRLKKIKSSCS